MSTQFTSLNNPQLPATFSTSLILPSHFVSTLPSHTSKGRTPCTKHSDQVFRNSIWAFPCREVPPYPVLTLVYYRTERPVPQTWQYNRIVRKTCHAKWDIDISLGGREGAFWLPMFELVKCAAGSSGTGRRKPAVTSAER
jgi:hypothetical protein